MADETTRAPVEEQEQEPREPAPDGDDEPIELPDRKALSIIWPDGGAGGPDLYPGLDPLRGPEPESGGITTPGGVPTS
jgi:hypothetical protein